MAYGNDNVVSYDRCQYLTVDGTSDSVTLSGNAKAITVRATVAVWVKVGRGTQTAVKPSGEKTAGETFYLPANTDRVLRVSGNDESPCIVAAIQDTTGGALYVTEHYDF